MTDFETFDSRPKRAELDDKKCRYLGCDKYANYAVRYSNPKEYVPYCRECGERMRNEMDFGKTLLSLK